METALELTATFVAAHPALVAGLGAAIVGLLYWAGGRPRRSRATLLPAFRAYPGISVVLHCHNHAATIAETLEQLARQNYPTFEIIAVDDGSSDATGAVLDALRQRHVRLRVVHLAARRGEAMALRTAAMLSRYDYLMVMDAEGWLDADAISWLMAHFLEGTRVAAVAARRVVRDTSGRSAGAWSIQRFFGGLTAAVPQAGEMIAFRKSALHEVGYWNPDTAAQDLDIGRKLESAHWELRFEPRALGWVPAAEMDQPRGLLRRLSRIGRARAATVGAAGERTVWSMRRRARTLVTRQRRDPNRPNRPERLPVSAIAAFFHVDANDLANWQQAGRVWLVHDQRGLIERVETERAPAPAQHAVLEVAMPALAPPPQSQPALQPVSQPVSQPRPPAQSRSQPRPRPRQVFAKRPGAFEHQGRQHYT